MNTRRASAMQRNEACPASAKECAPCPNIGSEASKTGTMLHAVAELVIGERIANEPIPSQRLESISRKFHVERADVDAGVEMFREIIGEIDLEWDIRCEVDLSFHPIDAPVKYTHKFDEEEGLWRFLKSPIGAHAAGS